MNGKFCSGPGAPETPCSVTWPGFHINDTYDIDYAHNEKPMGRDPQGQVTVPGRQRTVINSSLFSNLRCWGTSGVLLVALALTTLPAAGDDATLEAEARNLVSQYLIAIANGDTETIRTLIGGELLKSRSMLLDNPDYSAQLIEAHQDRTLSVTDANVVGPEQVEVDLRVKESGETRFDIHLLVAKTGGTSDELRIVSEY